MKKLAVFLLLFTGVVGEAFAGARLGVFMMKAKEFFFTKPEQELASAIVWNRTGKIEKLLSEGVDVNCRGKDGITPLIWAAIKQKKKSYEFLLKHGAYPNLQIRQGGSAILLASIMMDSDYLQIALEHGGNPNLVDPETGDTPIYEAMKNLREKNIDLLIKHGANLNFQDRTGCTPPMDAASVKRYDLVFKMLKAGANPTIKNNWDKTIVWYIEQLPMDPEHELYRWRNKVVELLREQGMDVRPWTPENGPGRELKPRAPFSWEK